MFGEMGNLLSYGGGALGIVGIVYFIIRFFLDKDDSEDKVVEQLEKEKQKNIKDTQKEVDKLKKKSDDLEKKQKEVKDKIDKTVDDFKKEKEEINKSDSVEKTVNMIEKEW